MKTTSVVAAVVAAALLAGCGESSSDDVRAGLEDLQQEEVSKQQPRGDAATCLAKDGFRGNDAFVATVIIDGAEQEAVVAVPGRDGEFAVIYKAPSPADAQRLAADYTGGPFAAAVGDRIYTFTSSEPTAAQQATFERCLA